MLQFLWFGIATRGTTTSMRSPARILVLGFAACMVVGSLLLTLPMATRDGQGLAFVDALFMATSAVCVTGLVVVDPGSVLTTFGQLVILLLIQVGGLGFMTIASLLAVLLGKRITIKERLILKEALNQNSLQGIVRLVQSIVVVAIAIEVAGALLLALAFATHMPISQALYYGLFHAVSAFNNAGFDLFGNSLINYQRHPFVQFIVATLIITGGLGFIVLLSIAQHRRQLRRVSLHTKLTVTTSLALLGVGTFSIFAIEYGQPALQHLPAIEQFLNSFFHSAAARSAGMNTVPLTQFSDATLLLIILLMFIGSSPGSTGGGIKTTTFAIVVLMVWHTLRGKSDISAFYRTVPPATIMRALVLVTLSVTLVLGVTIVLSISEQVPFLALLFESVSAFGTVGLSLGITAGLSEFGKLVIIATMFTGRVGILTLLFALASRIDSQPYRYPEDHVLIG
jgi:trk system potassium uptake protein TrkH